MHKNIVFLFCLFFSSISYALTYNLPKANNSLVGKYQTTQVKRNENFSDIAERFGVGYYEILEANPGINPDHPPVNTVLVVPTQYILPTELKDNKIIINLAEMRLYYQDKGKVHVFPVGIGKENWNTPTGEMSIVEKKENPTWIMPKSIYEFRKAAGEKNLKRIVSPGPENPLGKYSMRLSKIGYLIHGTNLPSGIGRRSTAGCIRLYPADIKKLYSMVKIGTKIKIINKPYKAGWMANKFYLEAHMPLFEERLKMGEDIQPALDVVSEASKDRKVKVDWQKVEKIAREHLTLPRVVGGR